MTACKPGAFELIKFKAPVIVSLDTAERIAYMLIIKHVPAPDYTYYKRHTRRKIASIFLAGYACIRMKTRIRQVVLMRYFMFWFCRNVLKYSLQKTGVTYGLLDHTSVLHGLNIVNDIMTLKYESGEKIALMEFIKMVG